LRLASPRARSRFNEFLHEVDHDELRKFLPRTALSTPQYVHAFIRVLDTLTEQQGKRFWLEKTPEHLHYIDYIEKHLTAPKFIHILRNGADVVASLYEVTHQYPEVWSGPWDIDQCISKWVRDVQLSSRHLHKFNHTLVRYDQLVEAPRQVLEELCEFINIEFDEAILQQRGSAVKKVVLMNEPWKASVSQAICNTKATKFYKQFNERQRQYILEKLAEHCQLNRLAQSVMDERH